MSFTQSGISNVQVTPDGLDLFVTWAYQGTESPTFQVYLNRHLSWFGTLPRCHIPRPASIPGQMLWVEVAAVSDTEATLDHSALLTASLGKQGRATLSWTGGTYLDPTGNDNLAGFRIYQGSAPGQPPDLTTPVDTVPAYPGGAINDGFGKNGFGEAGFGRSATTYQWQSPPLDAGTWSFSVIPYDHSGNARSAGQTTTVAVVSAPRPPGLAPDGSRLTLNYGGPASGSVTLAWLPSPSVPR